MRACAGPGKTAVEAVLGWNFLSCYGARGEHPKAAVMSMSGANLQDNLWAELNKWQQKSEFLRSTFTWNQKRISANDHPETWFMSARSFPKTANAEEIGRTLSGLHSKFILYIIDESGDISPNVLKSAEQGLSTGPIFGKIVQAGNPTSHTGMLYEAVTNGDQWHLIRITGDPDDPRRSKRIDADWARAQIKKYGRDNPWVMAFILGEFPPSALNSLLGPEDVERSMQTEHGEDKYTWSQKRLGVDVARFGDDDTVIFPRQGLVAFKPLVLKGEKTPAIAARIAKAKIDWGSEMEFVDGTGGFGAGVCDSLELAGYSPQEIHFSAKSPEPEYYNMRAYMWFKMAEWVKKNGALPNDPQLAKELIAPKYYFKNGMFLLEDKDQIKKRLGFSPDKGDALALTFAHPDQPASNSLEALFQKYKGGGRGHHADSDPYSDENMRKL